MALARSLMSLAFATVLSSCSVLIDRDRFEDGAAGGTAGGPQGGAPAVGGAPAGGRGGAGPTLECLNAQMHAGFDPPNDAYLGFLDDISIGDAGSVVTEPASDVRHGSGAFRIALTAEDQYAWLRSLAIDDEDVAYWVGFSQRVEDLNALTRGTMTFALWCNLGQDPWQRMVFGLEMDPDTPGQPYRSNGIALVDPEATGRGFDDLDQIPGSEQFSDWALHVKPSANEAGYVDVYHAGTRVFSAPGPNIPDPEVEVCESFDLRFGIYRWDGFGDGGADAAPQGQTLFLDELVLLKVDETPELDARALFTLDPDSGCFDRP